MTEQQTMELLEAAAVAREEAYAPYSGFAVGAAVRATDGRIFSGCNVENASYGLTVCAERVAVGKAISEGVRSFEAVAIVAGGDTHAMPCGACRQVLAEFCSAECRIVVAPVDNLREYDSMKLGHLLPRIFRLAARNAEPGEESL